MNLAQLKQRFGIIGFDASLDRAIEIAAQVAATDLAVLVTGESGTGKERIPQVIHHLSARKHGHYIAVNCGAIPEGTIDSELFGHEKGSFTGALDTRKGYFEVADGGTIFLDEVAELPLSTQARLLRVLETKEFIKVGSSKVQKTDVRIIAATNVTISQAIKKGKFREDLYYRLNTVPIHLPALREREDVLLLFRKFANDFSEKYNMPAIRLNENAEKLLLRYYFPGNIRQLKNITEQISIIEEVRIIDENLLAKYLPAIDQLPSLTNVTSSQDILEREIFYKVLFDLKQELADVKELIFNLLKGNTNEQNLQLLQRIFSEKNTSLRPETTELIEVSNKENSNFETTKAIKTLNLQDHQEIREDRSLSLIQKEKELIVKALEKNKNRRKEAAQELGISERTLYRKIKEFNLEA